MSCDVILFSGPIFSLQVDTEGDIITGGGKDGRIVATSPDGEILDETSLPDYVGGARCVVIGKACSKFEIFNILENMN